MKEQTEERCDLCGRHKPAHYGNSGSTFMEWENKVGENDGKSIMEELTFCSDRCLCEECFRESALHLLRLAVLDLEMERPKEKIHER